MDNVDKYPVNVKKSEKKEDTYHLVRGHGLMIGMAYCEDTANEIAAALNATTDGTFAWAVKWMLDNGGKQLTYGDGERHVYFDGVWFYEGSDEIQLNKCHVVSTDWRIAEVSE